MAQKPGALIAMERQDMLISLFEKVDVDHSGHLTVEDLHNPLAIAAIIQECEGAVSRGEAEATIVTLCNARGDAEIFTACVAFAPLRRPRAGNACRHIGFCLRIILRSHTISYPLPIRHPPPPPAHARLQRVCAVRIPGPSTTRLCFVCGL